MSALRVVLADDHPTVRMAVRAALEMNGFEVVAEAVSGEEAVAAVLATAPDLCLLDIHMTAGGDGIGAARQLSELVPGTVVVMLSASEADADLFASLRAGAMGYLRKDMNPDRLAAALRGVLAGEAALPRSLVTKVLAEFSANGHGRPPKLVKAGLTDREHEVLRLLAAGRSTQDIAAEMFIGVVTVRTHIANICKKLKVDTREAAVEYARSAQADV